ncbi:putative type I restriction enzymeP M protein [Maioricimonas rarisocia]|uniref:Putative type I restriction enzymeP M protein n=1 Tax=Maioricimonas rarisocia TaxID=2528026 RepID=A0A517Z599_9PLAN|nr:N-6 DNA methylase [Maioricimonas rarisocia]QDU37645.1 putative type I restriction enzymeP M protein [Maioricimonas rarisocia]
MAKKSKKQSGPTQAEVLGQAVALLRSDYGYDDLQIREVEGEQCAVATRDAHPILLVHVPEHLGPITPADEEFVTQLGAVVENGPADYVWSTSTGTSGEGFIYCWLPEQECQVSELPRSADVVTCKSSSGRTIVAADPVRFKELQQEFDALHEQIYASREPVDSSNDLTAQLCKLIFLKMHLERHRDFQVAGQPPLDAVFKAEYINEHKDVAVQQIRDAFSEAKDRDEYCAKDDKGRDFRIFPKEEFIKFTKPATYVRIAEVLNRHQLTSPEDSGVEDDVLGRAFDVMLRGKFEGKGGMGVYLTPQQVRDAMVEMAFHDITRDDAGAITRRDARTGKPGFRICDPCCGSAGFLVTAMRAIRKHVNRLVGLSSKQQLELLHDIFAEGFVGADNAHNMVLLARINMALHGDPRARVFRTENSLDSDVFASELYDLILTNPPFKKGGIKKDSNGSLLEFFQSDVEDGKPAMGGDGLALGAKPDSKGVWKPVNSVDPAVLFIDRCLQLLKPGGRLLIVLPDGILCNSGDRYVREYLMGKKDEASGQFVGGKAVVKAVVSLPPVTFRLSGAGAKTSFLYLQKKQPGDEQGPVFMAVADKIGFDVKQNKEVLTGENDLVKIVEAYKSGPTDVQE